MKANEAPEKIYVKITHPISDKYTELIAFEHGNGVEYTRTDVFIDKACEWLKEMFSEYENLTDYNPTEDFKNYMKGE